MSLVLEGSAAAAEDPLPSPFPDEAAFEAFYRLTAPRLRAYLRRMTGSASLADDVLQEAYVRLLRAPGLRPQEDQIRGYLWKTAANLVIDHARRTKGRGDELPAHLATSDTGADVILRSDMEKALDDLPARERTLLWMAYVEGASHKEIALALGLHEKSVRVMLFRSRGKAAAILRQRGFRPEASR